MLRLIGFVLRYLPIIISAITTIEALVSKDTSGEDKKTLAMKLIRETLTALGVVVTEQIEGFVSQVIDLAVMVLNLLGIFKRKDDVDEGEEETVALVSAAGAARAAEVVRQSPNDARLDELEALLKASR